MIISEYLTYLHNQLDHIVANQMSHAQKTGAIMLIQFDIASHKSELEDELYRETKKIKIEYLRDFKKIIDRVQHDIAKNSPLNGWLEEQKALLQQKAPLGSSIFEEDIPF